MDLYFSPLAGSLAARIALYEAGAEARFIEVDPKTKGTPDGSNFAAIYPLGLVPLLRLDDGSLLSENAAVLQYIANRFPRSNLTPTDELGRARLRQWLSFIGTELHQRLFCVLLDEAAPKRTRTHTLMKYKPHLTYLNDHLSDREFLLDHFTVADAYLYAVLNWSVRTRVSLSPFPAIKEYHRRLRIRPSVARAYQEELMLYRAKPASHHAA
jgi:glutathione S-transferase